MTSQDHPAAPSRHFRFELSGGGSGIAYRRYDYLSGLGTAQETLLGFVLVANVDSPRDYPQPLLAGREYSFFDHAVSDFSDVQVVLRGEPTRWPATSPATSQARWSWVVDSSQLTWAQRDASGDFYVPDSSGTDVPTGIGVDWASERSDGRITWFGDQAGAFFASLKVGDGAAFTLQRDVTVSGYTTSSTVPRA